MAQRLLSVIRYEVFCCKSISHVPVMKENVVKYLRDRNVVIDMTFGEGGHSKALLQASSNSVLICLDRDPFALKAAQSLALDYPQRVYPVLGKFSDLPEILKLLKINEVDGILFDYGFSSGQMDNADRGFSLNRTGPLDMRMNQESDSLTAADILEHAEEQDLYQIFKIYGQEKHSRQMARAVVEKRYTFSPIKTTTDLAKCIAEFYENRTDKLGRPSHPATKIFQALRIFVNDELNEIDYGMMLARHFLKIGGVLVTISFHSLEDTIVKRHLTGNVLDSSANPVPLRYSSHFPCDEKELKQNYNWTMLTKHVVLPSQEEVEANPRSRSAKLRAAIKLA